MPDRPKIICLCGSTRFTREMMLKMWELAKQGIIALGWNVLPDDYCRGGHGAEAEGVKEQIDELHKRKIDLSDEVLVLNCLRTRCTDCREWLGYRDPMRKCDCGGDPLSEPYIGESTRSEVEYAERVGKPVRWLNPQRK